MMLIFFFFFVFFFLIIRRPPRSTLDRSSAASDVYKRQVLERQRMPDLEGTHVRAQLARNLDRFAKITGIQRAYNSVSYTHLRAHETVLDLVCRLLLETKNNYH